MSNPQTVEKAVKALLKWRESKSNSQKPQLLEHDDFLYLIVTLKKIPQNPRTNAHKVPLPNPLMGSGEFCLIIDDRSKSGLTKEAALKKIKSQDIPVSKVLKLSKLKSNYVAFEAKRKLCDSYDMFFADRRVIPLLPRLLGKQFFKKKKIPVALDLKHQNWKEQIDRACSSALLYLSTGTCCVVKVATLSMESQEIVGNVMAAIAGIADVVPSKWKNIRSFHLKLVDSLALPVYQSVPDLKLKIESSKEFQEDSNLTKDGAVNDIAHKVDEKKSKKKGRIHEVRYMDSNVTETLDDYELGSSEVDDTALSENEDSDNDEIDGALGSDKGEELESQKVLKKVVEKKMKEKREDAFDQNKKRQKRNGEECKDEVVKKNKKIAIGKTTSGERKKGNGRIKPSGGKMTSAK